MKFLVLSVVLFCLAGTNGMAIHQQDEAEPQKPTLKDYVKSVYHHGMVFWAELVAHWESPEAERVAVLSKRMEIIMKNYYQLAYGIGESWAEIYKEVNKEINKTYPVFNNKVIPIFASFVVSAFENVGTAAEEIKPYFEKFKEHVKTQQNALWEEVRPIILKKAKPVIDALNASLKPLLEDVRKEVATAKNKEESESSSGQDPRVALMKENIKFAELLQEISLFNKEVLKQMESELQIFNTNA